MRIQQNAKLVSFNEETLKASNAVTGANHLMTTWTFVGSNEESNNKAFAFMLEHTSTNQSFNYIVDLGDLTAAKFVAMLQELGNTVPFTKYSYSIAELTDGREEFVNNGKRTYSSFSQVYLGDDKGANERDAHRAISDRLAKAVNDDGYQWGKVTIETNNTKGNGTKIV